MTTMLRTVYITQHMYTHLCMYVCMYVCMHMLVPFACRGIPAQAAGTSGRLLELLEEAEVEGGRVGQLGACSNLA